MKLETFFEKFELFADAPDAVAKLRELVLELAVNGHLSDHRSEDQLHPIWQNFLSGTGSLASAAVAPELPVPRGWCLVRLRDVADYHAASKVDPKEIPNNAWLLDLEELEKDSGRILEYKTFGEKGSTSTKAAFLSGDVLYGKLRPYLNKVVVAPKSGYCTTEIVPVRSRGVVAPEYLCCFLRSPRFVRYASAKSYGMKMPRLGTSDAEVVEILLPPPAEQKRIVAKVDELLALCDRLEAQQQEREARHAALARASLARFAEAPTPANLEFLFHNAYDISPADLRKSILTLAVQGKLVPQDPDDEPVDLLLTKSDEQRRKIAAVDRRADAENTLMLSEDDRWEIPESWSWRGLSDIVLFVDYRGKTPAKLSHGIRLVTAKNVRKRRIDLSPEEFLSEAEYRKWMTRGFPKVGDVLFTTEAPMGNAAVVELTERFALAQRVVCFQGYGTTDPSFLVLQILSEQFQSILDKNGTGVTAKGIKASKLKRLPLAIPPLAEQRRIVAKVDELMALVDKLEAQLVAARSTAANLLSAAVAELTRGEQHHVAADSEPAPEQLAVA